MRRAIRIGAGALGAAAVGLAISATSPWAQAAAPKSIDTCDLSSLESAVAAGGSYAFHCSGTITLGKPLVVGAGHSVSLDGTGQHVVLSGGGNQQNGQTGVAVFSVQDGTLSLTDLSIENSWVKGAQGTDGADGASGIDGDDDGTDGGNASDGSAGDDVEGGAIAILKGSATITGTTFSNISLNGGDGGMGGDGGEGNFGGGLGFPGSGNGGDGGDGGDGGGGGAALGGAIYNAGTLTLKSDTFTSDTATGGGGGNGGAGGAGNDAGFETGGGTAEDAPASFDCDDYDGECGQRGGEGRHGGSAGNAGHGGPGANGYGGAIYNAGTMTVSDTTFSQDGAAGGSGGDGGDAETIEEYGPPQSNNGGQGRPGGWGTNATAPATQSSAGGPGGPGGDGGSGGSGGDGGGGAGGAIWTKASPTSQQLRFSADTVGGGYGGKGGDGSDGGQGGNGGPAGCEIPPSQEDLNTPWSPFSDGGRGGNGGGGGSGGSGGDAEGGAVFGPFDPGAATFSADRAYDSYPGPAGDAGQPGDGGSGDDDGHLCNAGVYTGADAGYYRTTASPTAPTAPDGEDGAEGTAGRPGSGVDPDHDGRDTSGQASVATVHTLTASGSSLTETVACSTGSASCQVTITLSTTETVNQGHVTAVTAVTAEAASGKRKRTFKVGHATVSIKAGSKRKVTVKLNGSGRSLLAKFGRLPVRVASSQHGAKTVDRTVMFKRTRRRR